MTLEDFRKLRAGDIIVWRPREFPEDEISDNLLIVLKNEVLDGCFDGQHELKTKVLQTNSNYPSSNKEWFLHEDTHSEVFFVA